MKVSNLVLRRGAAVLLRRLAVALVIVALSRPAFAQYYGYEDQGRWSETEYSMWLDMWPYSSWNYGDWFGGEHGPKTIDGSTTIMATIRWVKGDGVTPAANPPAKVYLLEDASASWSGTNGEGMWVIGEARNGLGHPCVARTDGRAGCTSSGRRLVQVDGSSGVITRSVDAVAIASGSSDSTVGSIDVSVSYSLTVDNRGVTLTRQGARGEVVDAEGNTHGHTTYSYNLLTRNPINPQPIVTPVWNWQQFSTAFIGDWSLIWDENSYRNIPDVSWSWNPQYSGATWEWNQWSMPFGSQNKVEGSYGLSWKGRTGPTERVLTYTATDNRKGGTATAKYYLTIHDHYEQKTYQRTDTFENWRQCSANIVGPSSGSGYVEYAYTVGMSASGGGAAGEWIADLLGIDLSIEWSGNVNTGASINLTVKVGEYTYMEVGDHYIYHDGTVDVWDEAGYVGEEAYHVREVPANENNRIGYREHLPHIPYTP